MKQTIGKSGLLSFALVASLFLLWGLANNMNDTLLAAFKRILSLSDLQTSVVQFAFYGAYFCFALPAALFIRRFSYKAGILLGVALYAAGTLLFYPASSAASYGFFIFAIYVMASGCSILETAANPYILTMGPSETATQRLNVAQALNPLGAICGILLSRHFILSELHSAGAAERGQMDAETLATIQRHELTAISETYVLIGCVLMALFVVIALAKMPRERDDSAMKVSDIPTVFRQLWRNRRYRYGVVAQFFYVGVQTGVWSFTIRLVMAELGVLERDASMIFLYSIIAFTASRFLFTWLMSIISPVKLLGGASLAAIVLTVTVITTHGQTAVWALVAISACMSLMFPTIYGTALEGVTPETAKIAASGLIMAILGGALITPIQALISDMAGISKSFVVPAICFAVISAYSYGILSNKRYVGKRK